MISIIFLLEKNINFALAEQSKSQLPFQLTNWEETLDSFPCTSCHEDMPIESVDENDQLILDEHSHISLNHGKLRCKNCHNSENRDLLQTVTSRTVAFSEMEEVCKNCHIAEYLDWSVGIHGKLTGFWNGLQKALRCAECHDVHSPEPMTAVPNEPPQPPPEIPGLLKILRFTEF